MNVTSGGSTDVLDVTRGWAEGVEGVEGVGRA
jgi:hypothetical protein